MLHPYEGYYARFDTPDKTIGALMMGADDLVGDCYDVAFKVEDGASVAWVSNKFGAERGFFDAETSRRIQIAQGRGDTVAVLLSFLAYSDTPEPGEYWGEMAVICYSSADVDVMEGYVKRISALLAEGKRPDIDLNAKTVQQLFEDPEWVPTGRIPLPDRKKKGFALLKDHRTASERAIEQGRAGNKGCYVVSYLFIIVIVVAVVAGILAAVGVI